MDYNEKIDKINKVCSKCGHIVKYNPITKRIEHFADYKQYLVTTLELVCPNPTFSNITVTKEEVEANWNKYVYFDKSNED